MFAREFTHAGRELWGLSFVPKAIVHNDGRLGELQAAAKDLLPVEQRQPMREGARICVCVCEQEKGRKKCVDKGLAWEIDDATERNI